MAGGAGFGAGAEQQQQRADAAGAVSGNLPPIKPVEYVDLPRFMGNWYVIARFPPGSNAMPGTPWKPTD